MPTTDNLDEIFDIVDEQDRVIGQATRRECNSDRALIHRSAYCLVFNKQGELFLQKRSLTKDTNPGSWTVSVAGHLDQGEDYETSIIREMQEEIGSSAPVSFLAKYLFRYQTESEYSAIYRASDDGPFILNPEEISQGGFFPLKTIRTKVWPDLAPAAQMVFNRLEQDGFIFFPI